MQTNANRLPSFLQRRRTGEGKQQIQRAREIAASLGLRVAARYLQRRNWTFEGAHYILLGYWPRKD